MTDETLEKAKEIQKDIEFYNDTIGNIKYKMLCAADEKKKKKFMLRFINGKKRESDNAEARIILFENDNIYGSDIPVDTELLDIITKYFTEKRDMKKDELKLLN